MKRGLKAQLYSQAYSIANATGLDEKRIESLSRVERHNLREVKLDEKRIERPDLLT